MLDEVSTRSKVLGAVAVVVLLAAVGNLLYRAMADGQPSLAERQEAVRGQTNLLFCSGCGSSFEMPADEYLALADRRSDDGDEGVPCRRCGAAKAIKKDVLAQDAVPPAELAGRGDSLKLNEVQAFLKSVQKKQQAVESRLHGQAAQADEALRAKLQAEFDDLQSQHNWLDRKWGELAARR